MGRCSAPPWVRGRAPRLVSAHIPASRAGLCTAVWASARAGTPAGCCFPELASPAGLGCPSTVPMCIRSRSAVQPSGAPGPRPARVAHSLPGSRTRRRFTLELAQAAWTSAASVLSGHFEGMARPFNLRSECSSLRTSPKLTSPSLPWFLSKPPCCARGPERMRAGGGGSSGHRGPGS